MIRLIVCLKVLFVLVNIFTLGMVSIQGQQPNLAKQSKSNPVYFTAINWRNVAFLTENAEAANSGNDTAFYNTLRRNTYFQSIAFSSGKKKSQIEFEAFLSIHALIRKKEYFKNTDSITAYFHEKYDIGFFYDEQYEKGKKWGNMFVNLDAKITYDDFNLIVGKNLTIELIKLLNIAELTKDHKYTLIYNWDFFEETQVRPRGMNMLFKGLESIPVVETLHFERLDPLQYSSMTYLDVVHNYPDSKVVGILLSQNDLVKQKCSSLKYPLFECVKTNMGYEIWPNSRDFVTTYKSRYFNNPNMFRKDYQLMVDVYALKMKPFTIFTNDRRL